jgi:hypothetical protein
MSMYSIEFRISNFFLFIITASYKFHNKPFYFIYKLCGLLLRIVLLNKKVTNFNFVQQKKSYKQLKIKLITFVKIKKKLYNLH